MAAAPQLRRRSSVSRASWFTPAERTAELGIMINRGARHCDAADEPSGGSLYLVGTPIGHLGDLSPRARDLLRSVDVIACEDTRHSGQLLSSLGAGGRKLSFHQHNPRTRVPQLLDLLAEGQSLAVISDAGLPASATPVKSWWPQRTRPAIP